METPVINTLEERLKRNKESPTLRDQFAMNAMTGLMLRGMPIAPGQGGAADLVRVSYEIADEMLKQRETTTNES
jgi:hypothetical protein